MTDVATTVPTGHMDIQMQQARLLAASDLVGPHLRNKPANVYLILQYADALGIHPAHALSSIQVINGKPTLSAELMRALVQRAGHRFHISSSTDQEAAVIVARKEYPQDETVFTFTWKDAQTAGLAASDTYKKHPKAMLLARVTTQACRAVFADLLAGVSYDPEELAPALAETRITRHTDSDPAWNTPEPVDAEVVDIRTGEMLADAAELDASVERHPAGGSTVNVGRLTGPAARDRARNLSARATDAQLATIVKALRMLTSDPGDVARLLSAIVGRDVATLNELTKAEASDVIRELKQANTDLTPEPAS